MRPLNVFLLTFNCARTLVNIEHFARHLFSRQPSSAPPPDLIVLSLQEVAPISHAFVGGNLLLPYFRRFLMAIVRASRHQYELVTVRHVGMTAILVIARSEIAPLVRLVGVAEVGVGHWRMGNKGAVGVRLSVGDSSKAHLTFVAAHLAPMEDAVTRRNQDWKDIVTNLVFTPPKPQRSIGKGEVEPLISRQDQNNLDSKGTTMFVKRIPLFFAGDLNYRTSDVGPSEGAHTSFIQPGDLNGSSDGKKIASWRAADQLDRERLEKHTFHHLNELPVKFPPTYKYALGHQDLWPEDGSEPAAYKWSGHRFPSWCDRILFSSQLLASGNLLEAYSYDALPLQPTSDHRPVVLSFKLDLDQLTSNPDLLADSKPPFDLNPNWSSERAAARRLEFIVGGIAYLGLTWEGNAVLLASVIGAFGGFLLIQSLIEP